MPPVTALIQRLPKSNPRFCGKIREMKRNSPANPTRRKLAALLQQAHEATAAEDDERVREIETEID